MRYKSTITTLVITAVLVGLGLVAYYQILRPSYLNNVSRSKTVKLDQERNLAFGKYTSQEGIYSIEIEANGLTSTNFEVYIGPTSNMARAYHRALVKGGEVEYLYVSDWYEDSCYLLVVPKKPCNDSLEFSCRFISTD